MMIMTHRLTPPRSIRVSGAGFRARALLRFPSAVIVALAVTAALTALTTAPPANAAPPASAANQANQKAHPAHPAEAAAPRAAGEPIMAIVSIKSQRVTFYDADGWILRAPVSTGTTGRETPAGVFAVVEKDKDHHSSLYDDAWMPNMQRITWSGIALHGGPLPGYAASHGCIRMPYDFAEKLFDKTRIGMRVIISPNDAEPVEFSHPALFAPRADAIAAAPARAQALASEAEEAAKAAAAAKTAVAAAKREAAAAPAALRKLEYLKSRADAELAYAERALANANRDSAKTETAKIDAPKTDNSKADDAKAKAEEAKEKAAAKAEDLKEKAAAKAEELRGEVEAAKADQKAKQNAVAEALALAKTTEGKRIEAARAAKDAALALEPVSIFISRATQKLYVRRDTHKPEPDGGDRFDSFEVPIIIQNPGKPIGTHIFTAVARSDAGLRWTAVTIDNGGDAKDSAKDALDRITFPQEVLDRIAPTALPRSSIIISDEPLNRETNYRTEFVVVLNNRPQGGLAMRARPEDHPDGIDNGGFFSSWFNQGSQNRWANGGSQNGGPNGGYQDNAARPRAGRSYYPSGYQQPAYAPAYPPAYPQTGQRGFFQ